MMSLYFERIWSSSSSPWAVVVGTSYSDIMVTLSTASGTRRSADVTAASRSSASCNKENQGFGGKNGQKDGEGGPVERR